MNPKIRTILLFSFFTAVFLSSAQNGSIVLIGGGMERSGTMSWNYQLFSRIVNQASNKRVLVIGHSAGDGWLEQNFVNVWGATYSKELVITSSNANLQQTYDTIVTYGVIYFRGGDQYYYYNYIKNTKTAQALQYLYNHGGIIAGTSAGMHILSEVIFTDDTGYGIYPHEAIENPNHSNISLHDDLFL
ncbi:MAG TPA: Type 1 glutamine amidotransferase-like domain-containing protein, partial [Salinivirgaceae bacterium]|nr:Type 1 glutamine amidotransferase-like domain-containing protein [Salinivirgaceae bacterium]